MRSSFAIDAVSKLRSHKAPSRQRIKLRTNIKQRGSTYQCSYPDSGGGKNTEASGERSDRFKELLQALAEEHARELETQKLQYEEKLGALQIRKYVSDGEHAIASGGISRCQSTCSDFDATNSYAATKSDAMPLPHATVKKETLEEHRDSTMSGRPLPPTGPPPSLNLILSDTSLEATQAPTGLPECTHEEEQSRDWMVNVVPVCQEASVIEAERNSCQNLATKMNSDFSNSFWGRGGSQDDCDNNANDIHLEETADSPSRRRGMVMHDINAKWLGLVQLAIDTMWLDVHYPRQVWREALQSKCKAKGQLANAATKHLKRMMSDLSQRQSKLPKSKSYLSVQDILASVKSDTRRFEALDPHSGPRFAWTLMAALFIFYDILYVPMLVFKPPDHLAFYLMDMSAQVYWTLDIPCCFVTGVYVKSVLERRFIQIARMYARTWLGFDLLVTFPQWYSMLAAQNTSQFSSLRGIRFVRTLRFLRLARLAKMEHVLREVLDTINSPYVLLLIGTVKIMVWLCMFTHVISCGWFGIGSGGGGWVDRFGLQDKPIWYQYLSSTHWSLTQFQGTSEIVPGTTLERGYAVLFLLLALIILACFVSTLTTNMGQLQQLHNERHSQERAVRSYLSANGISTNLCIKVNRYIEWNRNQKQRKQQDAEVLLVLPTKLLMDIYDEVRGPVISHHLFFSTFRKKFSRVLRCVCYEALEQALPCPNELVYAEGDECCHMYFIMYGQLRYEPRPAIGRIKKAATCHWEEEIDNEDNEVLDDVYEGAAFRPVRVRENGWLSEAVLWTEWEHHGNLIGLEECAILMLHAMRFANIVKTSIAARTVASMYARNFIVSLNRFGHTFTDIIHHTDLFDYDDYDQEDRGRSTAIQFGRWSLTQTLSRDSN